MQPIRAAPRAFDRAARQRDCLACNDALHKAIHAASGNHEAMRLISTPDGLIRALRSRLGYGAERRGAAADQHAAIVGAIEARDAVCARQLAVAHIDAARTDLVARLVALEKPTGKSDTRPP